MGDVVYLPKLRKPRLVTSEEILAVSVYCSTMTGRSLPSYYEVMQTETGDEFFSITYVVDGEIIWGLTPMPFGWLLYGSDWEEVDRWYGPLQDFVKHLLGTTALVMGADHG